MAVIVEPQGLMRFWEAGSRTSHVVFRLQWLAGGAAVCLQCRPSNADCWRGQQPETPAGRNYSKSKLTAAARGKHSHPRLPEEMHTGGQQPFPPSQKNVGLDYIGRVHDHISEPLLSSEP